MSSIQILTLAFAAFGTLASILFTYRFLNELIGLIKAMRERNKS